MATAEPARHGSLASLWRYPVKSMLGEELIDAQLTDRGINGDRSYALIDSESGRVITAKNPRKWGRLFEFHAALVEASEPCASLPVARITTPDGASVMSDDPSIDGRLSALLSKPVRLTSSVPTMPRAQGYWPEYQWLPRPDSLFDFDLPAGTFFDCATVHLVTTATLEALASLAPRSRVAVARFRPNFVIALSNGATGFVEQDWVGRTLVLGDGVRLKITRPCERCVMTTLPQGDLPKDPEILRAIVQQNQGNFGVYASVVQGGRVRRGDPIALE
jgi:uncharacterized protein YcbX